MSQVGQAVALAAPVADFLLDSQGALDSKLIPVCCRTLDTVASQVDLERVLDAFRAIRLDPGQDILYLLQRLF